MNILERDPYLLPYALQLRERMDRLQAVRKKLPDSLTDFANGYRYFGIHRTETGWSYREWAPGADAMYLTGDFCGWNRHAWPMTREENGVFSVALPPVLKSGQTVMAVVVRDGVEHDRIPVYANYVVQNPTDGSWNAQIYDAPPFPWTDGGFVPESPLLIYECHVGMAQEKGVVGTYSQFRDTVLPKIRDLGYNTLQIMAVMEHPYYASFGYQVTNFFAPSSRFGTPDDLRSLIDTAHAMGISVLLDVVHSHASSNTREGIAAFDGTPWQFFHQGERGAHSAWGTKCFDYGKPGVLHFLLSNLKYWMEEFHFDGFRFDGVTSMLYRDHGLGTAFTSYGLYFSENTDLDAVTYLQLANLLVRELRPGAITVAEDTSAMPGLCLPIEEGGLGFDYRLAMGQPDLWIRTVRDRRDEDWDLGEIFFCLTDGRPGEKVIGYCESHDQALVGDKTLLFRMCDREMYTAMGKDSDNLTVERGIALHKLIRLLTMTLGGSGYLTFMGNEFGHPEWIDFPREGNGWSYHYCRRQWSLAEDPSLRYGQLRAFEQALVPVGKAVFSGTAVQTVCDNQRKVLCYEKNRVVFAVNLHPTASYTGLWVPVSKAGSYQVVLSSDDREYGGQDRIAHRQYEAGRQPAGGWGVQIYLPCRTAVVLEPAGPQQEK